MKKNLLKLLALSLVMGLFVGCSDSDDKDDEGTTPPPSTQMCVYTPSSSTIIVGAEYTVDCAADLLGEAQECTVTGTVDTATVGTYELAYAAPTCPNPAATATVTVKAEDVPDSGVDASNILPF